VPGAAHAHQSGANRGLSSWKLDLFPGLCLRVIDSDAEHGKTLLQLLGTRPSPVSCRKFGFQSAIYFERITRSRQFMGKSDHLVPFAYRAHRRQLFSVSRSNRASGPRFDEMPSPRAALTTSASHPIAIGPLSHPSQAEGGRAASDVGGLFSPHSDFVSSRPLPPHFRQGAG